MKRALGIGTLIALTFVVTGCSKSDDSDAPAANVKIGKPSDPGPKPSGMAGAGGGGAQNGAAAAAGTQ